jgi:peptidoglycan/xylan/chitin deacetylase (PgdA/CDA1 family)
MTALDGVASHTHHGLRRRDVLRVAGVCVACLAADAACSSKPATIAAHGAVSGDGSASPSTPEPQPAPSRVALPPEVRHGPRDRPGVALTFHGQGTAVQVNDLLVALDRGGAHGTILAVGTWLRSEPTFARRIVDSGHELGNHTMHHLALTSMSQSAVTAEIAGCAGVLRRLIGSIGTWFRPSQTQFATPVIHDAAVAVGYRATLSYDVDSLDYTDPGADAITRNVLRQAQRGSIISLHAGHDETVVAMPALLAGLRARGLQPMTMTALMTQ